MRDLNAALLQLDPSADLTTNVAVALQHCEIALTQGAELVVLPEGFAGVCAPVPAGVADWAQPPARAALSPAIAPFLARSRGTDALLVLGGVPERAPEDRGYNAALALWRGQIVARYHKVHRFDADLPSGPLRESAVIAAGIAPVVIDWSGIRLGLSICYDLRFPEFYRLLADAGAEVILVPSAFTQTTGQAHWHTLLRARAIENQAFVLAPALVGTHRPGRTSYGHTLAVDPWGEILADEPSRLGCVSVQLRADRLQEVRRQLPALQHRVVGSETSAEVVTLTSGDPPAQ